MIIHSLLDTDLYKFTMMQVVLHQFPGAQVEYKFKCRNPAVQLAPYVDEIREEIRHLCTLRFIKSDFVDFLGLFKLNEKYMSLAPLPNGEIDITIRGPWLHTILFEIPLLAIVNEVYSRNTQPQPDVAEGDRRLRNQRPRGQAQGRRTRQLRRPAGRRQRRRKAGHGHGWRQRCQQTARRAGFGQRLGRFPPLIPEFCPRTRWIGGTAINEGGARGAAPFFVIRPLMPSFPVICPFSPFSLFCPFAGARFAMVPGRHDPFSYRRRTWHTERGECIRD